MTTDTATIVNRAPAIAGRAPGVNGYLTRVLYEYEEHIREQQGNELSLKDRWCSGPDQHTKDFLGILEPSLRLLSFLLTEEYPLRWFCHLTFGERRRDELGAYIVQTPYSNSKEAVSRVHSNIEELGKVIGFAFMPHDWVDVQWGMTFSNSNSEKFRRFNKHDFPSPMSKYGKCHPIVVMSAQFQDYFRGVYFKSSRPSERWRAMFMFAVSLGHEIAHAYEFWLSGSQPQEPRWCQRDKFCELGFAWETHIIGHVLNPTQDGRAMFPFLCSLQLEEYTTLSDRNLFIKKALGQTKADFTTRDINGRHRSWAALYPREFRGSAWFLDPNATAFIASLHVIPLQWIVNWFMEDVMARRKQEWAQVKSYTQPTMIDAFMIIYERNEKGIHIQRPLSPSFAVDREIARQHAKARARRSPQAFNE